MKETEIQKQSLLDVPWADWPKAVENFGRKSFHASQLMSWIFEKRVRRFSEMSNLPADFRNQLEEKYTLRSLFLDNVKKSPEDGTMRFFFKTHDGKEVSCVYLPFEGRSSICLSTQVGCAWGCVFCASGLVKFKRNLSVGEILDQIFYVEETIGKKSDSLLFMGMGEPLANFKSLVEALRIIRADFGLGMGSRHVTVSTCGLVPQIKQLADEAPKVNLAVSLHASRDELRKKLLPKSSQWSIKELLGAVKEYSIKTRAFITFEYIILDGINDSEQDAKRLGNLIRGPAGKGNYKINLIAYNPVPGLPFKKPTMEKIERFKKILIDRHLKVYLRKPQGSDIGAGCGQLGEARL